MRPSWPRKRKVEGLTSNFGGRFARIFGLGQVFVGRFVRSFFTRPLSVRNHWCKKRHLSVLGTGDTRGGMRESGRADRANWSLELLGWASYSVEEEKS